MSHPVQKQRVRSHQSACSSLLAGAHHFELRGGGVGLTCVGTQSISCGSGPDHLNGPAVDKGAGSAVDKRAGSSPLRQDLDFGGICVPEMDTSSFIQGDLPLGRGYRVVIYLNQGQLFLEKCSEWQILGKFFRTVNMLDRSH